MYTHMNMSTLMCMHIQLYVYMYMHIQLYMFMCMDTQQYMYMCMHMQLYVYMCMSTHKVPYSFQEVYDSLPWVCKQRVKAVYILHPALWMRVALWTFGGWLTDK